MWDWIFANWDTIVSLLTVLAVGGVWLWVRYRGQQDKLLGDLKQLLQDALAYLQGWAKDRLDEVGQEDVYKVADWFYDAYVLGSPLEAIVSREQFRALLWSAFERIRGQKVRCNAFMAFGIKSRPS